MNDHGHRNPKMRMADISEMRLSEETFSFLLFLAEPSRAGGQPLSKLDISQSSPRSKSRLSVSQSVTKKSLISGCVVVMMSSFIHDITLSLTGWDGIARPAQPQCSLCLPLKEISCN
ncbi:hypothetical protein MPTK1_1g00800 [Marchantia polymorpha subsp. ruderalis]|uniref:Uncharacterized protein n=2 Tax=Marchantia polymorpha TaxID=3197 RepID=A0AAF6AK25_MARPO|nr:hypothetical protein MARPO_0103s0009 [Marchantia polymorpha]BBM96795.1 hypothetical protein Mp_1g00800 [Marchantia polymorpha subsp. ruderalis]|eukprot:PTQ32033.1 hypothetical protein MARPO_0103s0009 [Marchantia polymorpha]